MKGENLEKWASWNFHQKGVPVLISHLFLRRLNCGQIDLAIVSKVEEGEKLFLIEVKAQKLLSNRQRKRLLQSQSLISKVLNFPSHLLLVNYLDIARIWRKDFCQRDFTSLS